LSPKTKGRKEGRNELTHFVLVVGKKEGDTPIFFLRQKNKKRGKKFLSQRGKNLGKSSREEGDKEKSLSSVHTMEGKTERGLHLLQHLWRGGKEDGVIVVQEDLREGRCLRGSPCRWAEHVGKKGHTVVEARAGRAREKETGKRCSCRA